MKKILALSLALTLAGGLLASPFPAASQSADQHSGVRRLDSLFTHCLHMAGAKTDSVAYTGDGHPQGYTWSRGDAHGWTRGQRITVPCSDSAELNRIKAVFLGYSKLMFVNNSADNEVSTYDDKTATFYGAKLDRGNLFFLRATTDGLICVPRDWTTSVYFKGLPPKPDPFAGFSKQYVRLYHLANLWAEVKRNFVYYDRIRVNWDSLFVAAMPLIEKAESDEECAAIAQRLVAQLGDGHTYVDCSPLQSLPLTTKLLGGKLYVDQVGSSALRSAGVRRGMEISRLDDLAPKDYMDTFVIPYLSSSTPQWTEYLAYDGMLNVAPAHGKPLAIEFSDGKKPLRCYCFPDSLEWDLPGSLADDLTFRTLEGNIGLLKITSFNDFGVRAKFNDVYPDILKTQALIIDIRGNAGGNSGNADYIVRHLSDDSIPEQNWDSPLYCPAYRSWGIQMPPYKSTGKYMRPVMGRQHYLKPVVMLVDNGTFSAAEDFCSVVRSLHRGPVIGRPTGGSTGNGVRFTIFGDYGVNICSKHDYCHDGTEFVGIGITPDIPTTDTYQSCFIDNTDPALQAALDYLKKRLDTF